MMPEAKEKNLAQLICPACHTLNSPRAADCFQCNQSLNWLQDRPRFRAALLISPPELKASNEWKFRWTVKADWNGGHCEWTAHQSEPIETILGAGPSMVLALSADLAEISVRREETVCTYSVPGEITLENIRISVWCTAYVKADKRPELEGEREGATGLSHLREGTVGRQGNLIALCEPTVELENFVIASQENGGHKQFWVVDLRSDRGTWLNGQRIVAGPLNGGDLLQIGPVGWIYSQEEHFLLPARPMFGVGLGLHGVGKMAAPAHSTLEILRGREKHTFAESSRDSQRWILKPVDLRIEPAEFVAIRGPSGAGKSTLLKAIAGIPGARDAGQISVIENSIEQWDVDANPERYRELLGYVPQDCVVHASLTPRQALRYHGRLRGAIAHWEAVEQVVDEVLREQELSAQTADRLVQVLSGGEKKRVGTALELMARPRLLVLDEPDSGLDERRQERLMRHLRSLRLQGCTIVIVTHGPERLLAYCDRVVQLDELHVSELPAQSQHVMQNRPLRTSRGLIQFWLLLQRECQLVWNGFGSRIILPLSVSLLFAAVLAIGVADDLPLVGFLGILSSVWMGASLSLLEIAGERTVFDYEQNLFLRIRWFLLIKALVLGVISSLQTLAFVWVLYRMREAQGFQQLHGINWVIGLFLLTGWNGVALGLAISAIVNRGGDSATGMGNRGPQVASFLLPLVMLMQMVFSVQVTDIASSGNSFLEVERSFSKRWQAGASYLTITRYADFAMRTFAYASGDWDRATKGTFVKERRRNVGILGGIGGGLLLISGLALYLQSRGRLMKPIHFRGDAK